MRPLIKAFVSEKEKASAVEDMLRLWRNGDPRMIDALNGLALCEYDARRMFKKIFVESLGDSIWVNDVYQVIKRDCKNGQVHLSIRRNDRTHLRDWRHYQQIKNQLVGEECEAIELYPAESRLVDNANQFHLWCFLDPSFRVPVGWDKRMVCEDVDGIGNAQQRKFSED